MTELEDLPHSTTNEKQEIFISNGIGKCIERHQVSQSVLETIPRRQSSNGQRINRIKKGKIEGYLFLLWIEYQTKTLLDSQWY